MAQVSIYPSSKLPLPLKYQVLAFIRLEWGWVFQGENRFWDYTRKPTHPINVVVHEQYVVISHAQINWRMIQHAGRSYKVYGISAVFTYPSFRREGYGRQAVQTATDAIRRSDADVAMLFCLPHLQEFYESCGWTYLPNTRVLYGDLRQPDHPEEEILLMLFVSSLGKEGQSAFETLPIYVRNHIW
jgi:predicted acetyltransferase